jgi:tetratricopeptide (TPR) repeat protein
MADLDHVLARIIASRDAGGIAALRQHLPAEFVADLADLFEKRSDDPNRWLALASGLGEASLAAASAAAFQHILPLLSLAKERAKVYLEWARHEEARGRVREAATHYTTAARLDPTHDEAVRKAAALAKPLPPLAAGDWWVFGTLTDAPAFHRMATLALFPTIAATFAARPWPSATSWAGRTRSWARRSSARSWPSGDRGRYFWSNATSSATPA